MTDKPDPGRLPYQEITDHSYAQRAAANFTIEVPRRGMRVLRGECPRCEAIITIPLPPTMFDGSRWSITGILRRGAAEPDDPPPYHPVMCTCDTHEHAGRPEDATGCGAYWNFVIQPESA